MAKAIKQERLTPEQWQAARRRWERDPRDGYSWLVNELGMTVSINAVSQKAKRDGWAKELSGFQIAQEANKRADNAILLKEKNKNVHVNVHENVHETTFNDDDAITIRAQILTKHRDDWQEFRETFPKTELATNLEKAKIAKIVAEVTRMLHEGERKAWGLDIVAMDTGSGMKTREELNNVFNAMIASVQDEQEKADERFRRMEAEGL